MRIRARKDRNHPEIVRAFRELNCSVLDLGQIGGGCPDLLVGVRGRNLLVEVKDGEAIPSKRKLTPDQEEFFATWRGSKVVVETVDDVVTMVRAFSQV